MKWVENVACMEEVRNAYKIVAGKLRARNHLKDLGVDGKIILEWLIGK
jgi:hypothetical protein